MLGGNHLYPPTPAIAARPLQGSLRSGTARTGSKSRRQRAHSTAPSHAKALRQTLRRAACRGRGTKQKYSRKQRQHRNGHKPSAAARPCGKRGHKNMPLPSSVPKREKKPAPCSFIFHLGYKYIMYAKRRAPRAVSARRTPRSSAPTRRTGDGALCLSLTARPGSFDIFSASSSAVMQPALRVWADRGTMPR